MKSTIGNIWALLWVFVVITIENGVVAKKRVCVVGAGRAGLAVTKIIAERIGEFEPMTFERNSDVGGLWIYREDAELDEHGLPAHSGIYKNLRTVTYKDVMTYPDYPSITSSDGSTFITHDTFLQYMRNYTDHFQLAKYIQLNTMVKKVKPVKDKCNKATTRWLVKKQNLDTNIEEEVICDAIVICNGRYSKPYIPKIRGIEQFSGLVMHSRSYRKPEQFINKTVALLGAGLSGLGITRDLMNDANTVYLSHKNSYISDDEGFSWNVQVVSRVVAVEDNQLILLDKSRISADVLIYCTGYLYDFPFLDETSGMHTDGRRLEPLDKQFINKQHPSMAFIGLNYYDVNGAYFYSESKSFLESLQKM